MGCGGSDDAPRASALSLDFPAHAHEVLDGEEPFAAMNGGFELRAPEGSGTWRSVDIHVPDDGGAPLRLRTTGGFEVRVREIGASGDSELARNAVTYRGEHGRSFWASSPGGVEEWLLLPPGVAYAEQVAATWEIDGATLHGQDGVVDLLDDTGVPRMRVTAPRAYAVSARPVEARLAVRGATIELRVDGNGEEVLVDPAWTATMSMSIGRSHHSATRLPNGKVLVAGGGIGNNAFASTELFDPITNTWTPAASMGTARYAHAAVLLGNGKVLVAGGLEAHPQWSGAVLLASAEIYDPGANTWTTVGPLGVARANATATVLTNGRVLVAGGQDHLVNSLASAELFDPGTNTFTPAASMSTKRRAHGAALLANGRVLVAGGVGSTLLASAEIYDAATNAWAPAASMTSIRFDHTATALANGKVLVAGGAKGGFPYLATAEIYDADTNAWSSAGAMGKAVTEHTATLLDDGGVLVAGGWDGSFVKESMRFDPVTATWAFAGSWSVGRIAPTATLLENGQVLVAGGHTGNVALASAELWSAAGAAAGTSCASGAQCESGFCVDGVCCDTACGGGATDCQACSAAAGASQDGACGPSTGNACNDGNACTQTDTCQAGACAGSSPVTCLPIDACHDAGTCDPATGACSNPPNGNQGCASQICVTIRRGMNGSVQDAQIAADKPNKSYGSLTQMLAGTVAGSARQSLLRFDLGPIPQGATILSATVHLDQAYGTEEPIAANVHRVLAPWSEATVTWSGFAGAFDPAIVASFDSSLATIAFDVTALAQAWVNGLNHGMLIERAGSAGSSFVALSTSETGEKPSLEVCYVVAE